MLAALEHRHDVPVAQRRRGTSAADKPCPCVRVVRIQSVRDDCDRHVSAIHLIDRLIEHALSVGANPVDDAIPTDRLCVCHFLRGFATGAGGAPDAILDGETGYVVSDGPGVEARVTELLSDPARARAMGEKGQAWVDREWREELSAARLSAILAGLGPGPA